MAASLLLTQCLQNDFVMPIGRFDPIPNRLHVGYSEARRLMGEVPGEGPVARVMQWAYAMPDDRLRIVHIRDWHDPSDPDERAHLELFGRHCVRGTPGARFAFDVPEAHGKDVAVIDATTLNDFTGTRLSEVLAPWARTPVRVGIMGVWTEAKVTFLAYELRTRYPSFDVAVCSALTASSSRQHHFEALDHLSRILGVRLCDSVGELVAFLGGQDAEAPLVGLREGHPELRLDGLALDETDRTLARYLFRDCRTVALRKLAGGYSGNVVASARATDLRGHEQVPHVVKLGPRALMGQERTSFERVQDVLGNNAPQIAEFADYGDRGAIKYRYASMGGSFSTTFQRLYAGGAPLERVQQVLDTVFGEQLQRLYQAAELEECDLLEHYGFSERWAPNVRRRVEEIVGRPVGTGPIEVFAGGSTPNVCTLYETTLASLPRRPGDRCYQAYVHGDLNGANIILDDHANVWLIDFFHTRRAHVLMDLIKLENDLQYIFTPVADEEALRRAVRITEALLEVRDLGAPLPADPPVESEPFARTWATLRMLRAHVARLVQSGRDPLQHHIGALRYAVHTLSFDEPSNWQRKWALFAAGRLAERVTCALERSTELRPDRLAAALTAPGSVALTILPGRKDHRRQVDRDVALLAREGVTRVLCLVTPAELEHYGTVELPAAIQAAGMRLLRAPIVDQQACSLEDARAAVRFVDEGVRAGETVLVHCVGGLGRSGMIAACWLTMRGLDAERAIEEVRRARSPRAIETRAQEQLVRRFAQAGG